jgi:hypothetical protein
MRIPVLGIIVSGDLTPVLAKHPKSFSPISDLRGREFPPGYLPSRQVFFGVETIVRRSISVPMGRETNWTIGSRFLLTQSPTCRNRDVPKSDVSIFATLQIDRAG